MSDRLGVLWRDGPGRPRRSSGASRRRSSTTRDRRSCGIWRKGFVDHTSEGRLFHSFASVTEQEARGNALSRIVDKLFRGSALRVVIHMVESETPSHEEWRSRHVAPGRVNALPFDRR